MSLNIKNKEAHALARRLAELTGKSMAEAVTDALRKQAEVLEREAMIEERRARLMAIAKEIRSRMSPETLALDIDEYLYDENGLPK